MARTNSPDSASERLIASATSLFTARSYGSVGVQELCEEADVRRGSFYYHFGSKQELALAALDAEWDSLRTEIFEPAFGENLAPLVAFSRFWDLLHEHAVARSREFGAFGGSLLVSLAQEMAATDEIIRDRAMQHLARAGAYFEAGIGAAMDAGDVAAADTKAAARRMEAYVAGVLVVARAVGDPEAITQLRYELWRLAIPPAE
jgi:TetR/AcrR family transcriptional repressor of nem operon